MRLQAEAIEGLNRHAMSPDFIVKFIAWFHNSYPFVGQLFVVMTFDVLTGISAACITRKLNSSTGYNGMLRKAVMMLVVGLGIVLEPYAQDVPLGKMIALYFTFVEGLSILENVARAGVPVPPIIRDTLEKLRTSDNATAAHKGSIVNIHNAHTVDVHENTTTSTSSTHSNNSTGIPALAQPVIPAGAIPEVIQREDSAILRTKDLEVELAPEAIKAIRPRDDTVIGS